jgi:hypothetical protein
MLLLRELPLLLQKLLLRKALLQGAANSTATATSIANAVAV